MVKLLICATFLSAAVNPYSGICAAEAMSQRVSIPKPGARPVDACGSQVFAKFAGKEATPQMRAAIIAAAGHEGIRWIRPGTTVSQDFRPDRLNVILDEAGQVLTMRCG